MREDNYLEGLVHNRPVIFKIVDGTPYYPDHTNKRGYFWQATVVEQSRLDQLDRRERVEAEEAFKLTN